MRFLGVILLLAGVAAALGPDFVDLDLPAGEWQPIGFTLIAVGGVMAAIGGRRKRKPSRDRKGGPSKTSGIGYRQPEPEAEPEVRKPDITWGRGGDGDA